MLGALRACWHWLTREKVPPEGSIHDVDWRAEVRRLRLDVDTLSEHVVRLGEAGGVRLDGHDATVNEPITRWDSTSRRLHDLERRLSELAGGLSERVTALEHRAGGGADVVAGLGRDVRFNAQGLDQLAFRLDALERWRQAPDAKPDKVYCDTWTSPRGAVRPAELTPEEAARAAVLAGYDPEPCPECKQRTVVRSGGRWQCDNCSSCGQVGEPGYFAGKPAPPPTDEEEARQVLEWLWCRGMGGPDDDRDAKALAAELRRWWAARAGGTRGVSPPATRGKEARA